MKDFTLLYLACLYLPPGAYNYRLNLGNVYAVNFWSKCFTAETDLMEADWPPIVIYSIEIATSESDILRSNICVGIGVLAARLKGIRTRVQTERTKNIMIIMITFNRERLLPCSPTARI